MSAKYLPLLLIVGGGATYHICLKLLSRNQDPWFTLAAVYFVAFCASALVALFAGNAESWAVSLRSLGAAEVGVALACIGIELGVLAAYKYGWKVTDLSAHTGPAHCVAVGLVGFVLFRESVSATAVVGLVLAAAGVGLMHVR